ncbi:MAG: hypothetical protein VCD00_15415 [Candidatus Hydrogenedentota bacterium]
MTYSRRVLMTTVISIVVHIAMLWMAQSRVEAKPKPMAQAQPAPLVFRLEQAPEPEPDPEAEPERVKRIIETPDPTDEEVADTDLISDQNSKARDESDETGERVAPVSEVIDDFDAIEHVPTEPILQTPTIVELPPEPANVEQPTEEIVALEEPVAPVEEALDEVNEAAPEPEGQDVIETVLAELEEMVAQENEDNSDAEEPIEPVEPEEEPGERFQVARATAPEVPPPPRVIEQSLRAGRTREGGGASESGVINFEAKSHELGEFMLQVRKRVEFEWHSAIRMRYPSVRRVEAIILCSIRPDGMIESVEIIDPGTSMTFAILCRESIRDAAPFPELGFEVPEIYRSRNVDIRWRFSYM